MVGKCWHLHDGEHGDGVVPSVSRLAADEKVRRASWLKAENTIGRDSAETSSTSAARCAAQKSSSSFIPRAEEKARRRVSALFPRLTDVALKFMGKASGAGVDMLHCLAAMQILLSFRQIALTVQSLV